MVKYESGNYHDKNWSETIGTYGGMVIPDEETALKIAKAIFDGMEKEEQQASQKPENQPPGVINTIDINSLLNDSNV